jgi:hypothetical protein
MTKAKGEPAGIVAKQKPVTRKLGNRRARPAAKDCPHPISRRIKGTAWCGACDTEVK